jgi:hypothetical protein
MTSYRAAHGRDLAVAVVFTLAALFPLHGAITDRGILRVWALLALAGATFIAVLFGVPVIRRGPDVRLRADGLEYFLFLRWRFVPWWKIVRVTGPHKIPANWMGTNYMTLLLKLGDAKMPAPRTDAEVRALASEVQARAGS